MGKKIELIIIKPWEREKYPDWKTKTELKKMKLMPHPSAKARACVDCIIHGKSKPYYLYDENVTIPN